jgi:predicted nucleic acid-binding protein
MSGDDAEGDPARAARVVADADVLAADVLAGGSARDALDLVRRHSWATLVASDPLLDDAEAVVADLADADLAADWRERVEDLATLVEHPTGDHPALACALHGDAAHVLTFDDRLLGADAAASLRARVEASVRTPDAFAAVFDPGPLYDAAVGGDYPGPDHDPRA